MYVKRTILLKQIGAKIAYYRTLRDMSQSELAKQVCLSRSALSRIERGKYNDNVSVVILSDIADALWIVVNKVDRKSESREKNIFKSIGGKKIDGRMRTLIVIKALNILKKRKV